jgi:hypothetical protein
VVDRRLVDSLDGNVIHHAGHTLSNDTEVMWLPGSKLGVFVSVNTHSPVDVEHQVAVMALGLMVTAKTGRRATAQPAVSPPVQVSSRTLRRAAGRYGGAGGIDLVKADGRALLWTPAAQEPNPASFTMTPRADGWYTDAAGSWSIKIVAVAGIQLCSAERQLVRSGGSRNGSRAITECRRPGGIVPAAIEPSTCTRAHMPVR